MTNDELKNVWNYFLTLEEDLLETMRYVEPTQLEVFSYEYQKIIILSCCEVEAAFKYLCPSCCSKSDSYPNIDIFKASIKDQYPKIREATVYIKRTQLYVRPFEEWFEKNPFWWKAYQKIMHNRGESFSYATLKNAIYSLSGLQILVYYLAAHYDLEFENWYTKLIDSDYSCPFLLTVAPKKLPDFE